jgi:hypothetical protein
LKEKRQAVMEKQRGQDLGQKTMFFHPKIPKTSVLHLGMQIVFLQKTKSPCPVFAMSK